MKQLKVWTIAGRLTFGTQFTKPLKDSKMEAVSVIDNNNADTPKKSKAWAALIICIVVAIMVISLGIINKHHRNKIYEPLANKWDAEYGKFEDCKYYMVLKDKDDYLLITGYNVENLKLMSGKIPATPEWLANGTKEALEGKDTEQAMFAAKYHTLKKSDNKNEILVLGISLFEHPECMDEEQERQCRQSLCWHMAN